MKLYEILNGSVIRVLDNIYTPPGSPEIKMHDILYFDHTDGMYSYCLKNKDLVHLGASTEVEYYRDKTMVKYYQNIIKELENEIDY